MPPTLAALGGTPSCTAPIPPALDPHPLTPPYNAILSQARMTSKAMCFAVLVAMVAVVMSAPMIQSIGSAEFRENLDSMEAENESNLKEQKAKLLEDLDSMDKKFGISVEKTATAGPKDASGKPLIQNKNWQCPGSGADCSGNNCMCQPKHPSCCRWTGQVLKAVTCQLNMACKNKWRPRSRAGDPPQPPAPGPVTAPIGNEEEHVMDKEYVSLSNFYQN